MPQFEFFENGKKSEDWTVDEVTWSDSAGNHTEPSGHTTLCPHETVWNLNGRVFRGAEAQFPPQNVWGLPELKLPGPGQCYAVSLSTNLQGVKVSVLGIGGPDSKVIYCNWCSSRSQSGGRGGDRDEGFQQQDRGGMWPAPCCSRLCGPGPRPAFGLALPPTAWGQSWIGDAIADVLRFISSLSVQDRAGY